MRHSILDIPHLEINMRQESDSRRINLSPSASKTKRLIHNGIMYGQRLWRGTTRKFCKALNVTYQSNIYTRNRKKISANAWKVNNNWTIWCYLCPLQSRPYQKVWENWQADLTLTYKISRTIALSSNLKICTCLEDAHPTVWVLSKSQGRVLKNTGWYGNIITPLF